MKILLTLFILFIFGIMYAWKQILDNHGVINRKLIITGVILGGALIVGYIVYKKIIVKPQANMNSGMGSNMGGGSAKTASFD